MRRIVKGIIISLAPLLAHAARLPVPINTDMHWTPRVNLDIESGQASTGLLDTMLPIHHSDHSVAFVGARIVLSDAPPNFPSKYQQRFFSADAGFRQEINNTGILGIYGAIDRDRTIFNTYASQAVAGIEWLSGIDFRSNLYFPYGHRVISQGESFGLVNGGPVLTGHQVFLEGFDNSIAYQRGFDAEIGGRIPFISGLHLFGGYYYFAQKDDATRIKGISARLDEVLTKHVHVVMHYMRDHIQGTQFTFGVLFTLGGAPQSDDQNDLSNRLMDMIQRHNGVQASPDIHDKGLVLIKDDVYYINSNAAAGGDGAFETPFQTSLEYNAAQGGGLVPNNAFIYLYQGNGTTYTGLNTLTGTQELFGQAQNWVEQGLTLIPGSEAQRPNINNLSANGTNRISGIGMINTVNTNATPAIIISAGDTTIDNVIVGNGAIGYRFGVQVANASATINNSTITADSDAAAGANSAVFTGAIGTPQTLTISNSTITASSTQTDTTVIAINFGFAAANQMSANISNSTITAIGADPDELQRTRGLFVTGGAANSVITVNGGSISATNINAASVANQDHALAVEVTNNGFGTTTLNNVTTTAEVNGAGIASAATIINGVGGSYNFNINGGIYTARATATNGEAIAIHSDQTITASNMIVSNATINAIGVNNNNANATGVLANGAVSTIALNSNSITATVNGPGTTTSVTTAAGGAITTNGSNTCSPTSGFCP